MKAKTLLVIALAAISLAAISPRARVVPPSVVPNAGSSAGSGGGGGVSDDDLPNDNPFLREPYRKSVHIVISSLTHAQSDGITSFAADLGFEILDVQLFWQKIQPNSSTDFVMGQNVNFDYKYFLERCHEKGLRVNFHYQNSPAWANDGNATSGGPPADYQDYADFLTTFINYVKPGGTLSTLNGWPATDRVVYSIESFREPNLGEEDGGRWVVWDGDSFEWERDPTGFAEFTNLQFEAIEAADPGMLKIAAAMCLFCNGPDADAYIEDAITAGLDTPDAFAYTGNYDKDDVFVNQNTGLTNFRNAINTMPGADAIGLWCMECGAGNTFCGEASQTGQAAVITQFYGPGGALDVWRTQSRFVDRIFWTLLTDHSEIGDGDPFGLGGLMWSTPQYPPANPNPGECPQSGAVKPLAYAAMKAIAAIP